MDKALIVSIAALAALSGCNRTAEGANNSVADTPGNTTAAVQSQPTDPQIVEGLSGRTSRVELADGRVLQVSHNVDGTAHMTDDQGLDMVGRWSVTQGKLCFDWPEQPRECWPYGGPLTPGQTVRSTSDRGQVITTTLLDDAAQPAATNSTAPAT
jgi:hypothetical protein